MRMKGEDADKMMDLDGGHSDMIRSVKLSSDGMLCLSASSDGVVRLWDIGLKKCIRVYGNERKRKNT